jgi:hypothetical protein
MYGAPPLIHTCSVLTRILGHQRLTDTAGNGDWCLLYGAPPTQAAQITPPTTWHAVNIRREGLLAPKGLLLDLAALALAAHHPGLIDKRLADVDALPRFL